MTRFGLAGFRSLLYLQVVNGDRNAVPGQLLTDRHPSFDSLHEAPPTRWRRGRNDGACGVPVRRGGRTGAEAAGSVCLDVAGAFVRRRADTATQGAGRQGLEVGRGLELPADQSAGRTLARMLRSGLIVVRREGGRVLVRELPRISPLPVYR